MRVSCLCVGNATLELAMHRCIQKRWLPFHNFIKEVSYFPTELMQQGWGGIKPLLHVRNGNKEVEPQGRNQVETDRIHKRNTFWIAITMQQGIVLHKKGPTRKHICNFKMTRWCARLFVGGSGHHLVFHLVTWKLLVQFLCNIVESKLKGFIPMLSFAFGLSGKGIVFKFVKEMSFLHLLQRTED